MGLFKTKDDVVKKPSKKELKKNKKNSKRTAPSLDELEIGLTQQQFDSRPAQQNIPNNNQNFLINKHNIQMLVIKRNLLIKV